MNGSRSALRQRGYKGFTKARNAPAHKTDRYFQKWRNASFSSQARAVASLAASSAWSFCRALPRTRLRLRSKGQRVCLSCFAACLLFVRRRVLSARRT